jgi:hypothetical protein
MEGNGRLRVQVPPEGKASPSLLLGSWHLLVPPRLLSPNNRGLATKQGFFGEAIYNFRKNMSTIIFL